MGSDLRQTLYGCLTFIVYWGIAYNCLRTVSPVFEDGAGPMPSFYWGSPLLLSAAEYYSLKTYYDCIHSLPYLVAGLVMAVAGCYGAPFLVGRNDALAEYYVTSTVVAAFSLTVLLAAVSDAGTLLGWWNGPLFVLREIGFDDVLVLSRLFLPVSLFAGLVAVMKRRQAGA